MSIRVLDSLWAEVTERENEIDRLTSFRPKGYVLVQTPCFVLIQHVAIVAAQIQIAYRALPRINLLKHRHTKALLPSAPIEVIDAEHAPIFYSTNHTTPAQQFNNPQTHTAISGPRIRWITRRLMRRIVRLITANGRTIALHRMHGLKLSRAGCTIARREQRMSGAIQCALLTNARAPFPIAAARLNFYNCSAIGAGDLH